MGDLDGQTAELVGEPCKELVAVHQRTRYRSATAASGRPDSSADDAGLAWCAAAHSQPPQRLRVPLGIGPSSCSSRIAESSASHHGPGWKSFMSSEAQERETAAGVSDPT